MGALGLPAAAFRLSGTHVEPAYASLMYGVAIVGGAFLLAWAAEAAQVDVSASLAIAVLALITILPEYVVEAVLAWNAGKAFALDPVNAVEVGYVAANVTGAIRLLIGLGWSLVILVVWLRQRQSLVVSNGLGLELTILLIATLLSFLFLPLRSVPLWLAGILALLYLWYLYVSSRKGVEEVDLHGPAAAIGSMAALPRRATVLSLFAYAAFVILIAAEPFVEGLIETGKAAGVDEFLLIQWLAPMASESPEIIVALIFALRGNSTAAITALVSAQVSQSTLLIASMPGIFSVALGQPHAFPLDPRQMTEFLLASSLSLYGVSQLAKSPVSWWQGLLLLAFFILHLFFPGEEERRMASYILLGATAAFLVAQPVRFIGIVRLSRGLFVVPQAGAQA